ncbi:MAG: hypothetical protein QF535_20965, partial [Anaerolineales bacterium]|nr:hypothetical protein [Anaerolineales bacterium]
CTEEYNGSTWSEGGALGTGRYPPGGAGSQNAGLAFAGSFHGSTATERYDGSAWAAAEAMNTTSKCRRGAGTQNAALAGAGQCPTSQTTCTEEYDGTSWAVAAALVKATRDSILSGQVNATLSFGGSYGCVEEYDGSAWACRGSFIDANYVWMTGGGKSINAAIGFGGYAYHSSNNCTREWDGVSWSAGGAMITGDRHGSGIGTLESHLKAGTGTPTAHGCVEEYTSYAPKVELNIGHLTTVSASIDGVSGYTTNYFESGSTAFSGGVYGTMLSGSTEVRNQLKTEGIRNTNKLIVNRSFQVPIFEVAPVTASAGELWYSAPDKALKFSFSVNTWTAGGALITARKEPGGTGIQNAGLLVGGDHPASSQCTEEYNGSSWAAGGALIAKKNA